MNLSPASYPLLTEDQTPLRIQTLGDFRIWRDAEEIPGAAWKREKALHLFQFFVTMRRRVLHLHKEQIIDHLWPELDFEEGDRDFKVALHTIHKVLEPERKARAEPRFIQRHGLAYGLNPELVWIDADGFEMLMARGNQALLDNNIEAAIAYHQQALALYKGDYLPERRYEDWSSAERERLQVLALGLMTTLADLLLAFNPLESIRLTQHVLAIDPVWENAYHTQMRAYMAQGNRPLALRIYEQCLKVLKHELGVEPLPETRRLYEQILNDQ
jgi:DNA-binding SARP family transcriptional activator